MGLSAVGTAVPFVRMDNRIIRQRTPGIHRPEDVGLFALLSSFLSIPGFRTPSGGLHRLVEKHCSNGRYSINTAWQRLAQAGYLKRTRLPDEDFRLQDVYTLHGLPDESTPAVRYASLSLGRRLLQQHRAFLPPGENYTAVSIHMLMDARLSLAAKGVYALIRQKLQLSAHVHGVTIHKEALRRSSGLGDCAFRRVFRELKETGYLSLQHVWDAERAQMTYLYSLAEQVTLPEPTALPTPADEEPGAYPWEGKGNALASTDHQKSTHAKNPVAADNPPALPLLQAKNADCREAQTYEALPPLQAQEDVRDLIRERIEYEVLLERDNSKALLDIVVDLMMQITLFPPGKTITIQGAAYSAALVRRTLEALDANEVEFAVTVAAKAAREQHIRNMRAYLLCCLFRAKVDFAMSVTLF